MWLRLYTELLNDPKVQLLPPEQFKGWVNLLCLAKERDGLLPSVRDVAFRLRMSEAEATCLLVDLAKQGLLDENDDGYKPHNWETRQYASEGASRREPLKPSKPYSELRKSGKANYVYVIGTTLACAVKIGISKNPWARIEDFQTGSPEKLSVLATFRADTYSEVEIHDILSEFRQHREWFALPEEIQNVITTAADNKENYDQLLARLRSGRSRTTTLLHTDTESDTESDTEQNTESGADAPRVVGSPEVETVFAYWQAALNHPQAKLTTERKKKIQARLTQGYSVEQIQTAIDGCRASPYHMGQNDSGTVYDDIELICRNGSKLESFISKVNQPTGGSNGRNQVPHRETHNERAARETAELIAAAFETPGGDSGPHSADASAPWIAADFCRA